MNTYKKIYVVFSGGSARATVRSSRVSLKKVPSDLIISWPAKDLEKAIELCSMAIGNSMGVMAFPISDKQAGWNRYSIKDDNYREKGTIEVKIDFEVA